MDSIRRKTGSLGRQGVWTTEEGYIIGPFGLCRVPDARGWWVIHQGTGAAVAEIPTLKDARKVAEALQLIPDNPWVSKNYRQLSKNTALKQAVKDKLIGLGLS